VSCCRSLTDLVSLALHTVKVAFRTELCVAEVRDRIEPPGASSLSWSALIPGLSGDVAAAAIQEFSDGKV
jgi:Starter unit:ACP transacylase in aflatoxin biosynthesis